jgi:ProP effector
MTRAPDPALAATAKATTEAALTLLCELFPRAFVRYERRRRPLKVGIHEDLRVALDGALTDVELRHALRVYCTNVVYRSRLVAGATRVDLNGEPAGTVSEEHALASTPNPKAAGAPKPKPKVVTSKPKAASALLPSVKRMSLRDLREAAQRRKAESSVNEERNHGRD